MEARGAIETAHRVKYACGQVFTYGVATGQCKRNSAADLRDAPQPVYVTHHAAISDPKRVGELLRAMAGNQGHAVTRAALQLALLLFQRPGEFRMAEWSEFDLDSGLWLIPSGRMKRTVQGKASGAAHAVPLSLQAVARPMSDATVLTALRRMGFPKDEMTGHGFRAIARTMLAERLGVNESVIETQLAHNVSDSLGRAYNRTTFVDQRRAMMQEWGDYLDRLRKCADVVPLHGRTA